MTFTFYATFGSGQPGYPGYLRVTVDAPDERHADLAARNRIQKATSGRWCRLYDNLDDLHEDDRIYRGEA